MTARAPRFFNEPEERADLFGRNTVLDLLEAQLRQAIEADPVLEGPLRARLARLLPLEPVPARGIDGAVAPAPSRDAAPKPQATTEPEARPTSRPEELPPAPAALPGDLDRLVSLANLAAYLKHHGRTLRPGAFRDAVNVHADFVNRELALVKARLDSVNPGGDRGAA